MRNMAVTYTLDAVRERRKTVTRRKGWTFLKPGDRLRLVEKGMGLKKGERVVPVATVEVVSVKREPLLLVARSGEVEREGFLNMTAVEFIAAFFTPQNIKPSDLVTRIEWRYVDPCGACGAIPNPPAWRDAAYPEQVLCQPCVEWGQENFRRALGIGVTL